MIGPREHWGTSADGVRVHALEWAGGTADTALVFVPGGTGNAWSAETIGNAMLDRRIGQQRRVLGVSRRGMGLSEAPARNYTPRHFADDVEALVTAANISRFVLFGHSMGVPISIEVALRRPRGLVGLVLGDAPAQYIDFAEAGTFDPVFTRPFQFDSWDEAFARVGLGDRPRFDRIRHRYMAERDRRIVVLIDRAGLQRTIDESRAAQTDYWKRLSEITSPVMLLRARLGRSPLTDQDVQRYVAALPDLRLATLPTEHDLGLNSGTGTLFAALSGFLEEIDALGVTQAAKRNPA